MFVSALKEIGPNCANMCNVALKDELIESSPDEPLVWDPVDSFSKIQLKSKEMCMNKNLQ